MSGCADCRRRRVVNGESLCSQSPPDLPHPIVAVGLNRALLWLFGSDDIDAIGCQHHDPPEVLHDIIDRRADVFAEWRAAAERAVSDWLWDQDRAGWSVPANKATATRIGWIAAQAARAAGACDFRVSIRYSPRTGLAVDILPA